MILYHGSNSVVRKIDINKCRHRKDFGRGFYLTSIEEQAHAFAKRKCKHYGGDPVVSIFDYNDIEDIGLSILAFDMADWNWAEFVLYNRFSKRVDEGYDIVIGPVANDDLFLLFEQFMLSLATKEKIIEELTFKKLNNQLCFKTEKAINMLRYTGHKVLRLGK